MDTPTLTPNLTDHVAAIVASYLSHNVVSAADIPNVITTVHAAMQNLGQPELLPVVAPTPAVPVRKSITPDYIICLEDGKKLKMLKRHLSVTYGLTPDDYRTKWGLNKDYPMVAPNYAAQRSSLAKALGLGTTATRHRQPAAPPAARVRRNRKATVAAAS